MSFWDSYEGDKFYDDWHFEKDSFKKAHFQKAYENTNITFSIFQLSRQL